MKNDEIIKSIQMITTNNIPAYDISSYLWNNHCYYLLHLYKDNYFIDKLKAKVSYQSIKASDCYEQCSTIFKLLQNIPYAIIKGVILSKMAYKNIGYRTSADIDMLISKNHLNILKEILLENKFIQGRVINNEIIPYTRKEIVYHLSFSHQIAPFIKITESKINPIICFDINTSVVWGESTIIIDPSSFLAYTENVILADVNISKLNCIYEFIALCLHHYKDLNSIYLLSSGSLKINLFCDIFFYLNNNSMDFDQCKKISDDFKISKFIYYCVYYSNIIFNSKILSDFLYVFYDAHDELLLNSFGLTKEEQKIWDISFIDRLFHDNFKSYFYSKISKEDKEKIRINQMFMEGSKYIGKKSSFSLS